MSAIVIGAIGAFGIFASGCSKPAEDEGPKPGAMVTDDGKPAPAAAANAPAAPGEDIMKGRKGGGGGAPAPPGPAPR